MEIFFFFQKFINTEQVTVLDLRCANLVIAARLYSHAHQYMEHMVDNYLCLAKERFEQSRNVSYISISEVHVDI